MNVAEQQQLGISIDELQRDAVSAFDKVVTLVIGAGYATSKNKVADMAGRGNINRAMKGTLCFGLATIANLNSLISDSALRRTIRNILEEHDAKVELSRLGSLTEAQQRARRRGADEPKAWNEMACILQQANGINPSLDRIEDVRSQSDTLIEKPRQMFGEATALANAYLLMRGYRTSTRLNNSGNRLAMLDLIGCVIDLAAQLNNTRVLNQVADALREEVRPELRAALELKVCDRMIAETRARIIKYGPHSRMPKNIEEAKSWTDLSLAIELTDDEVAQLARDWPSLALNWMAPFMSRIGMAVFQKKPTAVINDFLDAHDKATCLVQFRGLSPTLLGESMKKKTYADIYAADLLVSIQISEEKYDDATELSRHLLREMPITRGSDSARASVMLSICDALLQKHGRRRDWSPLAKAQYRTAKAQAFEAFRALGMTKKMKRLYTEEPKYGYVEA